MPARRTSRDRRENGWMRQLEAVSSACCTAPSGVAWASTFSLGQLRLGKTFSHPRGSAWYRARYRYSSETHGRGGCLRVTLSIFNLPTIVCWSIDDDEPTCSHETTHPVWRRPQTGNGVGSHSSSLSESYSRCYDMQSREEADGFQIFYWGAC